MNSTLKSLLFWMVLIVVGVMIWQFSNAFQRTENPMAFSTFLGHVEKGDVRSVTITGNEITGVLTTSVGGDGIGTKFRTYAPTQYEGLANKLQDQKNKRMIKADDALKTVFGGKATVNMFEMTKLVNKHLKG